MVMSPESVILLGVGSLLLLVAAVIIGIPIAFSIIFAATVFLIIVAGLPYTISVCGIYIYGVTSNDVLTALPLFMERLRVSRDGL